MTGGVYKRGSTYSYVVDAGKEGGRRKQVWVGGFRTRREALAARAEALVKIHAGTYVPTTRETLAEFVDEWLGAIRSTVRESTWKSYGSLLRLHVLPELGATQLRDLRPAQLNKLYGELLVNGRRRGNGGLSRRTVRYTHTVLHRALRDAVRWGRVVRNVAGLADPPAPARPEMKIWSTGQLKLFLAYVAEDRLHACYLLAATTGMRRGELLGLRWQDVDLDDARVPSGRRW